MSSTNISKKSCNKEKCCDIKNSNVKKDNNTESEDDNSNHNELDYNNKWQLIKKKFWGNCMNTFDEEQKQYKYAELMGLKCSGYSFQLDEPSKILDIGGTPVSILLKTNKILPHSLIVDPLMNEYPLWIKERYKHANIDTCNLFLDQIEKINDNFDETWIYNVLQYTTDPVKILKNIKKKSRILRIFEWIDIPPNNGFKHMLTEKMLNNALGVKGNVVQLNSNGCYGKAWFYFGDPEKHITYLGPTLMGPIN